MLFIYLKELYLILVNIVSSFYFFDQTNNNLNNVEYKNKGKEDCKDLFCNEILKI